MTQKLAELTLSNKRLVDLFKEKTTFEIDDVVFVHTEGQFEAGWKAVLVAYRRIRMSILLARRQLEVMSLMEQCKGKPNLRDQVVYLPTNRT